MLQAPLPPNSIAWGKQGEGKALKDVQQAAWNAAFQSQLQEFEYEITHIEGEIPDELRGSTLFRNGPSRFERGQQRVSHYLDGDGYLAKITFTREGKVHFTSRFISTAEHKLEETTNAFQFRTTFGNPLKHPLSLLLDLHLKNPANTHIVAWGDKLLALYEAGAPYRIDPHTLETLGLETLSGELNSNPLPRSRLGALLRRRGQQAMTAHPHIDPASNRLITWTWGIQVNLHKPNSLNLEIIEYDSNWQSLSLTTHEMPSAVVNPHDFALTPNYYIFFQNAFSLRILDYLLGRKSPADCLTLKPIPTKVHLIPRPDGSKAGNAPLVLDTEQWFSIHQACAWENADGSVEIYSSGWPATTGGFLTSWSGYAPDFDAIAPTFLYHTQIYPSTQTVTHRITPALENYCIAHPHTNTQTETQPSQYLYMAYCNNIGQSSPPTGYLKYNTQTQEIETWNAHPLNFAEEPVFVPHSQGNKDDGWLLCLMYDHLRDRSALNIFDTTKLSTGPICRLWLTHPLAHGLHGSWVKATYPPA
ncbi:Retinal pigment epithelial membrane protein [Synechococcus sp. PCC 7335]|nr:Retinal pigment epithelial membrane protein [Synechococcus sp. PCC 7335]